MLWSLGKWIRHKGYRIGLYFNDTSSQWVWRNGEETGYIPWQSDHPNPSASNYCGYNEYLGLWLFGFGCLLGKDLVHFGNRTFELENLKHLVWSLDLVIDSLGYNIFPTHLLFIIFWLDIDKIKRIDLRLHGPISFKNTVL